MTFRILPVLMVTAGVLTACGPQYVPLVVDGTQDVPARSALYVEDPTNLHDDFEARCSSPGDQFLRVDASTAQCRLLPTPEEAAYLLIEFDAKLEAPKVIFQKVTTPTADGFQVQMSHFAEITAKSGQTQRVYIKQPRIDRMFDRLMRRAGGELTDSS